MRIHSPAGEDEAVHSVEERGLKVEFERGGPGLRGVNRHWGMLRLSVVGASAGTADDEPPGAAVGRVLGIDVDGDAREGPAAVARDGLLHGEALEREEPVTGHESGNWLAWAVHGVLSRVA